MKRLSLSLLFVSLLTAAFAQEVPPELAQLKAPYVQATTAIRANAEARVKPLTTSYLSALVQMEKQFASDPVISVMLVQEMGRVGAGKATTAADIARFSPALMQLRAKYDADVKAAKAPFTQQEAQYTRQYLASLSALERRFTAQNAVAKAAAVQAENQRISTELGVVPAGEKPKVVAESTVTAGTVKAIGSLDPALADKIAAAVQAKAYIRTANSKQPAATNWADIPTDGAMLVGFEFCQNGNDGWIRCMRPYFLTKQGVVAGKDRGQIDKVTDKVVARPGYAIAGLLINEHKEMQVIFMKINPATGLFLTDPANTYKSQSFGKKTRDKLKLLGGDGQPVIGVYGNTTADCEDLGLVMMNK